MGYEEQPDETGALSAIGQENDYQRCNSTTRRCGLESLEHLKMRDMVSRTQAQSLQINRSDTKVLPDSST